jgi:hypothetical protein
MLAVILVVVLLRPGKGGQKPTRKVSSSVTVDSSLAGAAWIEMEDDRFRSAQGLIAELINSLRFHEITSINVSEKSVKAAGSIEGGDSPESSRRLTDIKLGLEELCGDVRTTKSEAVDEALEFEIELGCVPELMGGLESEAMLNLYPLCARTWQMAEDKRRGGLEYQAEKDVESAVESFGRAARLFTGSSKAAELEKEMFGVEGEIKAMKAKIEAAAYPDTLILGSGKEIKCAVIEEDEDAIRIQTMEGKKRIPRRNIKTITLITPEELKELSELQSKMETTIESKFALKAQVDRLHLESIEIYSHSGQS